MTEARFIRAFTHRPPNIRRSICRFICARSNVYVMHQGAQWVFFNASTGHRAITDFAGAYASLKAARLAEKKK